MRIYIPIHMVKCTGQIIVLMWSQPITALSSILHGPCTSVLQFFCSTYWSFSLVQLMPWQQTFLLCIIKSHLIFWNFSLQVLQFGKVVLYNLYDVCGSYFCDMIVTAIMLLYNLQLQSGCQMSFCKKKMGQFPVVWCHGLIHSVGVSAVCLCGCDLELHSDSGQTNLSGWVVWLSDLLCCFLVVWCLRG